MKSTDSEKVTAHIQQLETPLTEVVTFLRNTILATADTVSEHIKWNSPSFYYNGEMKLFDPKEYKRDIVVMNLHKGSVLLVFPTGSKIKDTSGFLEGKYTDGRRIARILDLEDAKLKANALQDVIRDWLGKVE